MEQKQLEKIEQWFHQLNRSIKEESLSTKQLVENRFNMLAVSMQNLLDRMIRLEERLGKQDTEVIILKLAVKKLEQDFEILRQRVH